MCIRDSLVGVLRAAILTFGHDAGRNMRDAHGRVGLVDMLPTGPGGAVGIDTQISRVKVDITNSVSYTHLDVYKRQAPITAAPCPSAVTDAGEEGGAGRACAVPKTNTGNSAKEIAIFLKFIFLSSAYFFRRRREITPIKPKLANNKAEVAGSGTD